MGWLFEASSSGVPRRRRAHGTAVACELWASQLLVRLACGCPEAVLRRSRTERTLRWLLQTTYCNSTRSGYCPSTSTAIVRGRDTTVLVRRRESESANAGNGREMGNGVRLSLPPRGRFDLGRSISGSLKYRAYMPPWKCLA
jgi:hypothetical protein